VNLHQAPACERREGLPPRVAAALAAAEIPPSKLGPARSARLTDPERELYFWVLRCCATRGHPSSAEIHEAGGRLGLDVKQALETLAREDLVHLDGHGEIAVAYPFSGRPTVHRVRFPSGQEAYAMCAIDALGIAPMFEEPIEIASQDPLTREEVRARIAPDGDGTWHPESAVVVAGAIDCCGESFRGCCPALNFFASRESAERWLEEHTDVRGNVISIPDAIAAGRAVFGAVLDRLMPTERESGASVTKT
jgi:alkylmercury lyase-like protein